MNLEFPRAITLYKNPAPFEKNVTKIITNCPSGLIEWKGGGSGVISNFINLVDKGGSVDLLLTSYNSITCRNLADCVLNS
jgi:hypothetical protein